MANEILIEPDPTPNQLCFCVTGSLSPGDSGTDWRIGSPTTVALTLASLADGAGRQSLKGDLGAQFAEEYDVFAAVDFTGETPTADESVEFYWAPSTSSTQANGNVAGNSGGDAACPDGALGSITLAEFLRWCIFIGAMAVHDGASVQNGYVGRFSPPTRYGQLIVVNNSGDAFEADDVENHVVLNPYVREIQ